MFCEQITLKSGQKRWYCMADAPPDPATGKRRQIKRAGKTRGEARKRVEDAIDAIKNTGLNKKIDLNTTFEQIAHEWLESYKRTGKSKNTIRIRSNQIDRLNDRMAKVKVSEINHFMYQQVIYDIAQDVAYNTLDGINTCAGMIFRYAIRNGLLTDNPRTDVVLPRKRKTVEEIKENKLEERYLETDEINEFLNAVIKYGLPLDKERFFTLAFSGMRPGELTALQKQDLDFENNTININKTLYNPNNNMRKYELDIPKTEGSIRVIKMDKPIMDMLKKLVMKNDEYKLQYKLLLDEYHDKDFVFARPNGYPYVTKTLANRMNRILEKTSIKKHATPHIFRHTHISMLAEAGVDLPTIMQKVGHDDIETTLKIYTHVTDKMKKDASEKTSSLFGNILEKVSL